MKWEIIGWTRSWACLSCSIGEDITRQCLSCQTWDYTWEIIDRMPQLTPYGWNKGNVKPIPREPKQIKPTQLKLF